MGRGSRNSPEFGSAFVKTINTARAAKLAGVTRQTLQNWIAAGKFEPPPLDLSHGAPARRMWTAADIARLKTTRKIVFGAGRTGRPKSRKSKR